MQVHTLVGLTGTALFTCTGLTAYHHCCPVNFQSNSVLYGYELTVSANVARSHQGLYGGYQMLT